MMKPRSPILLLVLLICSLGAAASPDSLRRLELFIDTDPGFGAGTQYTIPVQRDTFSAAGINMTVPLATRPGWHTLYLRNFADSAGRHGRWSLTAARPFFVPVKIVAAEYFFDTDPGSGAGNAIVVATPADMVALTKSVATAGLGAGAHTLYVRTKNNLGQWGLTEAKSFFIKGAVASGEYFFDNDPGTGAGTAYTFSPAGDTVSKTVSIVTPASMPDGRHTLYTRSRSSADVWSLAQGREFFVLPRINAAEYFFDHDPGVGQATALSISPVSDVVTGNYSISTTGLPGGPHQLYVRSRSVSGRWSLAQAQAFYVRYKIIAAEYYWDTDPGAGSGVTLSVSPQSDTVAQSYSIKTPCLAPGTHHIYLRTMDERGRWSLAQEDTATFSNPAVTATATYPGPGPYGTPVKVAGSGGTGPYKYAYGTGMPVPDSLFLPPNAVSATFTATDTCGYSGSTTVNTPAAPAMIAGHVSGTGSGTVNLSGYRFWAYVQDAGGNIIGAVRDNRQSLGTVTMSYLKNNSGTVRQYPVNGQRYLDRNWNIASANAPAGNVGVQLFAVDSEYNALAAADPFVTSKASLRINKYDGPNEDLSIANNGAPGAYTLIQPDSIVAFAGQTVAGNGYALAFSVTDFSEFYESRNTAVALPLQSVDLSAAKAGRAIRLNWHTSGEKATLAHHLSRGSSSGAMQELTRLQPQSGIANDYAYTDEQPLAGASYYRVSVEGHNGEQYHSQIVVVRMSDERILSVAPNPAHGVLQIGGLESGDAISLHDMAGHAVWQGSAAGSGMHIATSVFAVGIYMLVVDAADGSRIVQRIEIVH